MISVFIVAASPPARAGLANLLVARGIEVTARVANLDELSGHLDDTPVDAILGVDVFENQAAVIDYGSTSLFLKDVQPAVLELQEFQSSSPLQSASG